MPVNRFATAVSEPSGIRFSQPGPLNARVDWEGRTYDIEIRSMTHEWEMDPNGVGRTPLEVTGVVTREGSHPTVARGRGRIMITHAGYTDLAEITRLRTTIERGITTLDVRAYHIERRPDSEIEPGTGLTLDEMALRLPGETNAQARTRGEQALREIRDELAGVRQGAAREPNLREVWAD